MQRCVNEHDADGPEHLRELIALRLRNAGNADVCLSEEDDGPSLIVLLNSTRAFVMRLESPGDVGVTARDANGGTTAEAFHLANGQLDCFPRSMTVTVEQALGAIEYFERTLAADPAIEWA